ncbi:MAG: YceI family protein [Oceanipulchritudo sp.]
MKAQHILDRARRGLTLTLTVLALAGGTLQAADYRIEKHRIEWSGSMPAKTHTGLLTPKSFKVSITDEGKVESLDVDLDMTGIDVTDLEGKNRTKLIKHLSSEDFFFVEKYPVSTFQLEQYADGLLHGTITIRGIAKHMAIPVTVKGSPEQGWVLSGRFTFNRQDFNVNYQNGGLFGVAKDKLIRDEVQLDIELKVKKA